MNFEVRIKQKYLNGTVFNWKYVELRMYQKILMRFTQESYIVTILISNTYLVHGTFLKIPTCQNIWYLIHIIGIN